MPSEAARLDPEGRGAARRGGCFNPPQYRPETNLLGFRVSIWIPAGRVKREALDRAKTTSTLDIRQIYSATARAQRVAMRPRCLANSRRVIRKRGRLRRSGLRLAQAGKESTAGCSDFAASAGGWLRQLGREQAAEDSSGEGCSDLLASASRALQLEQVESQKRLPRESCGCAGLSPKLHCARLGRSRALGLRKRSSRAELLCLQRPAKGRRL